MPATPRKPGMCADCGVRKPGPRSKSRCEKCHDLQTERGKRYRERNKEILRERELARRRSDDEYRERRNADAKRWRERNPELARQLVQDRRARAEAKQQDIETRRGYLAEKRKDPEWVARQRAYYHPLNQRRRARKLNAPGHFTRQEWRDLCEKHGHRCVYCGKQTRLTADHVIPLARGGSNYIYNILPACQPCNSRKHTKSVDEFCPPVLF